MTIPILDLPNSSCAARVTMTLRRTVGVTQSPFTLEQQSFLWPGEAWMMDFGLPNITDRETAQEWIAFALKLRGTYGYFLAGDPAAKNPIGIGTGSPTVNGAGQIGPDLATSGWTPSTAGILKAGDYIQIGSADTAQLLMVADDVNSDGGGDAVLSVMPNVRNGPADGSPIIVNNPRGLFRLQDNSWSWSVVPGPVYQLSFQASEVVNA